MLKMVVEIISTESEKMYKYCVTNGRNINTIDECYTPPAVYDTVLDYAVERYNLQDKHVVRPFIPGGDYQKYVYDKNDVVIDNPPFSMTTKIAKWYINHDIPFFLFINGQYAVSLSRGVHGKATVIATNANASFYHKPNNKVIKLGFVTNLEPKNIVLHGDVALTDKLNDLAKKKALNKFKYPKNIIRNSDVLTAIHRGVELKLTTNNCLFEDRLDYHKEHKLSGVVGGCYLVDDNVYNEYKAAMEKVPPHTHHVVLSEREKAIIEKLNKRSGD